MSLVLRRVGTRRQVLAGQLLFLVLSSGHERALSSEHRPILHPVGMRICPLIGESKGLPSPLEQAWMLEKAFEEPLPDVCSTSLAFQKVLSVYRRRDRRRLRLE